MKKIIKSIFEKIGYEIRKTVFVPGERMGIDPFNDITIIQSKSCIGVIFFLFISR